MQLRRREDEEQAREYPDAITPVLETRDRLDVRIVVVADAERDDVNQ